MAKYVAKVGDWVTPSETTGSIQNTSTSITIEVTSNAEANEGLLLAPMQIINFDGTVYVRSAGKKDATFTAVPFKVSAGGGGSSGGGGSTYTLPTASSTLKGGIKVGSGLTISSEVLSADKQIVDWKANTAYKANDLVIYNNILYKAKSAFTSSSLFDANNWIAISSSSDSKISNWNANTEYKSGDLVIQNNTLYQAKTAHTSGTTFSESNWNAISSSDKGLSQWKQNTEYTIGDYVVYGNFIYRCAYTHTSGTTFEKTKWTSLRAKSHLFDFESPVAYYPNELVYVNGSIYRCLNMHSATSTFEADVANFELVHSDLKNWAANTYYTVGVTVVNDKKLYMCKTTHTSAATFDATKWDLIGGSESSYTIPDWQTSKEYNKENIVYYFGTIYRCNTDHISSTFSADNAKWDIIYSDLENWQASVYYKVGTTAIYNNIIYKCTTAHESSSTFDATKWKELGSSGSSLSAWVTAKAYKLGDTVIYNDSLYVANTAHTSSAFSSDVTNWNLVYADIKTWKANTYYTVGVVAINDNKIYRCTSNHTSGSTFDSTEKGKWTELGNGESGFEDWETDTDYEAGDIVVYGNILYKCNTNHTSDTTDFAPDRSKWNIFHTPNAFISDWVGGDYYEKGQIVVSGGLVYKCKTTHKAGTLFDTTEKSNWDNVTEEGLSINEWVSAKKYAIGDFVLYHNKMYQCKVANTDTNFTIANWQEIGEIGDYKSGVDYLVGELVFNDNKLCRCKTAHTSTATFDKSKWDIIGESRTSLEYWATSIKYKSGEVVVRENSIYICTKDHTSTTFKADIVNWQKLDNIPDWKAATDYFVGDYLYYDKNLYKVTKDFTSATTFNATNLEMLGGTPLTDKEVQNTIDSFNPVLAQYQATRELYTTGERAVGIWVDGKTIYQKSYVGTTPATANSTTNWVADNSLANIEALIDLSGSVTLTNGNKMPINLVIDATDNYSKLWVTTASLRGVVGSNVASGKFYVTIKYTKV